MIFMWHCTFFTLFSYTIFVSDEMPAMCCQSDVLLRWEDALHRSRHMAQ